MFNTRRLCATEQEDMQQIFDSISDGSWLMQNIAVVTSILVVIK
jgi:hypothetical protein